MKCNRKIFVYFENLDGWNFSTKFIYCIYIALWSKTLPGITDLY